MNKFREEVAEMFIDSLDEDPIKFIKGWDFSDTGLPINDFTNKKYNGVNSFYLKMMEFKFGFGDNRWLTFKQIKDKDYHLKKGSTGTKVEYWLYYDNKDKKFLTWNEYNKISDKTEKLDDMTDRYILKPKFYTVFNGSQIEGIKPLENKNIEYNITEEEIINKISNSINVPIEEVSNSQAAYYSPTEDKIHLPKKEQFKSQSNYIRTALHELSHSTGHISRLNRDIENSFGSRKYAIEELIAEISSCFMSEYIKEPITDENLDQHKAYIQSWSSILKKDKKVLFQAIKQAEKASDYMIEKAELNKLEEKIIDKSVNEDKSKEQIDLSFFNEPIQTPELEAPIL